jgi:transposase
MAKKNIESRIDDIRSGDLVILTQDEVHLLWGDVMGYVWGKKSSRLSIPMTNFRYSETYYGSLNLFSGAFHLSAHKRGNSECTIAYLEYLRSLYPEQRLILIWDGATYHRSAELKEYLERINGDLPPEQWRLTLWFFAPNAPEQNPVEDVWLRGKNYLREHFADCLTFAQTKSLFIDFLSRSTFLFEKVKWYIGDLQIN